MANTYRAAYWVSTDCSGTVRLTTEDQSQMSDEDLMAAALQAAEATGLEIGDGSIQIGDFTE